MATPPTLALRGGTSQIVEIPSTRIQENRGAADLPILDCDDTCPFCWGPETD
ncbi:hypothetical protein PUN71_022660 [Arthrobacter sp. NQ7]|uniref:hypothetical protein n=1 Tax=Arthrobacter sp. NQ7 TaxID=3032303 RepID=UPI00240EA1C2|nr:hypothetical protein [Arthrobacter sp. NQ7]MDJ0460015.1 hypothetical protein [Arthrobacter sp. NQ7]